MPRLTCRADAAKGWRPQEVIREIQIRMIEKVESLSPKLEIQALGQRRVLHQRRIQVLIAGSRENISAGIAKGARSRKDKSARVEPTLGRATRKVRIADQIWPIVGAKPER